MNDFEKDIKRTDRVGLGRDVSSPGAKVPMLKDNNLAREFLPIDRELQTVSQLALNEAIKAMKVWPKFNSAHEGFAVLLEEVDELRAHVWTNQTKRNLAQMQNEAIQVAAMALRFASEVCTEGRGRK